MYTEDRNLHYFREISRIPRKSFHEKAVVDYIQRFAEERGLRFQRDTLHNLILWAPATPGREGEAPLMLQAHTDMVCAKEPWSTHDFLKDPIELVEENGWLHANGTTLGADDGAGVANILAILDEPELSHPPLECVFTVQEEVGLRGAKTAAYGVEPDYGIAVDVTDSDDIPSAPHECSSSAGKGAAIKVMDSSVICHPSVVAKLEELAKAGEIPCQKDILRFGGTDAGAIHQSRAGVYTGGISIPTRYVHTPLEMADAGDIEACAALVAAFAQARLD